MTEKLSRRLFLKVAAALAASGALVWKADELPADETETQSDAEWLPDPPPFAPYYTDKWTVGKLPLHWQFADTPMISQLAYLSGLPIAEVTRKVEGHPWQLEAILDFYREHGSFPLDD